MPQYLQFVVYSKSEVMPEFAIRFDFKFLWRTLAELSKMFTCCYLRNCTRGLVATAVAELPSAMHLVGRKARLRNQAAEPRFVIALGVRRDLQAATCAKSPSCSDLIE